MNCDCCSDERVAQFNMVTLGILPQIISRQLPDFEVNGNAVDRGE